MSKYTFELVDNDICATCMHYDTASETFTSCPKKEEIYNRLIKEESFTIETCDHFEEPFNNNVKN